ncbi:MAG: ATP phosphoribosyltransferase [Oscillospiraceae bacterium]|jgi:ATP phosphoribosyltransferase|nr:ATP phosphoribosyltransferase [Oscillospiraceae bacterium]
MSLATPAGTMDKLFADCEHRREMEGKLAGLFREEGYREVMTPLLEYLSVYDNSPLPSSAMRKLIDRDGRVLVLRPDSTLPVARAVQARLRGRELPLRVYYLQSVFRETSRRAEEMQAGVELIGATGLQADIEVLSLAARALEVCGAGDYVMEINHSGRESDPAGAEAEVTALCEALASRGCGGHIRAGAGASPQIGYYTGVVFACYVPGAGREVLRGGRYDKLHGSFGFRAASCGFAVDIDTLQGCVGENAVLPSGAPLRVALTKGRLLEYAADMFERAGAERGALLRPGRRLVIPARVAGMDVEFILAKAGDVLTYVANGVCGAGVCGKDTLMESDADVREALDLGFGRCSLVFAGPEGLDVRQLGGRLRIATKYPAASRAYAASRGWVADIIKIESSAETAPALGLADAIIDIAETGDTLRAHNLAVLEEICPISARLVVNKAIMRTRRREMEALIAACV